MNICCREEFRQGEVLEQEENHTFEFKNLDLFSRNPINDYNLKKTICGMLNCFGGYLFLGVEENPFDKSHTVRGYKLNENEKEIVKKYFNSVSECFYPRVDTSQKELQVTFVRVTCGTQNIFVPKVTIQKGKTNRFYSFRHRVSKLSNIDDGDIEVNLHFRRYDNESKLVSSMAEIYTEILKRSQKKEEPPSSLCTCKKQPTYGYQGQTKTKNEHGDILPESLIYGEESHSNGKLVASDFSSMTQDYNTILDSAFLEEDFLKHLEDDSPHNDTSEMKTYYQQPYRYTLVSNVPLDHQDEFLSLVYSFQVTGILSSTSDKEFKSYKIPLSSKLQHERLSKRVKEWVEQTSVFSKREVKVVWGD